ncbi:MAG TPA: hypothetical protein VMH83_02635 [Candidatus Acidoferrum sp.]|nr:hypothetical protein [Candidatus Acidoferrum sp.]
MTALWRQRTLAVMVLLLLAWQGTFAVQVLVSDVITFVVQRDVIYWGSADRKPTAEAVDDALVRIDQALVLWPRHPDYLALKARLFAWRGQIAVTRDDADTQFRFAIDTMRQALEQRPSNPYNWAQYAEYLATQRGRTLEVRQAADKVRMLGAGEARLQERMQALLAR